MDQPRYADGRFAPKNMADSLPVLDQMCEVMASARRLQEAVPDAVLVGGTPAALYAGHRISYDHDHVVADLQERYDTVFQALEETEGWVLSARATKRPMTIMGSVDGVEAGVRNLRRKVPLEVEMIDGVRVPTMPEALRIKAWLVLQRRSVRDYLDVAALSDKMGAVGAGRVLAGMDDYYRAGEDETVTTRLAEALANPRVSDQRTLRVLPRYKGLVPKWRDWEKVVAQCQDVCAELVKG